MKKVLIIMIIVCFCLCLVACEKTDDEQIVEQLIELDKLNESGEKQESGEKAEPLPQGKYDNVEQNPVVTMEMEDGGVVKIELYPNVAPTTVENFISLVKSGFYNGLIFHRVIPGFMAQGGDPDGIGTGGPGYSIKGEFNDNNFTNNLKHDVGVISMARAKDPNSAGSQFFIVTGEEAYANLDGLYAGFGKVIEGMDEVYKIVESPVTYSTNDFEAAYYKLLSGGQLDSNDIAIVEAYQAGEVFDYPINPPKIKTMTVETFGVDYAEPEKIQ